MIRKTKPKKSKNHITGRYDRNKIVPIGLSGPKVMISLSQARETQIAIPIISSLQKFIRRLLLC